MCIRRQTVSPQNSNVKQTVYTYDANGNQITKTAEGKTETNTYDGLNQLIGFTDGETTASYKYNASGLRYEKTVDGQTINHVWDGNKQIVADVIDNQFYEADCYIRGTNLVAKYNYWNGKKTEYTYYTQNAHGDVVNLTDKDGKVTKRYRYDAFGVEKNIDENDANAFRYCGEYYDKETATVYLRARYYDPDIGRFMSRDSVTGKNEDPLSLNLYTYCANNPIYYSDPTGHIFVLDDVAIGIGVIAAACIIYSSAVCTNATTSPKKNISIDSRAKAVIGASLICTLVPNWVLSTGKLLADNIKVPSCQENVKINSKFATYYDIGGYSSQSDWQKTSLNMMNQLMEDNIINAANNDIYLDGQSFATSVKTLNELNNSIVYAKKSKKSGKEMASDIPSWARGEKPLEGESGKDFARRLCDDKYGKGNYDTGPGSEYNKLRKYGDRGFN